MVLMTSMRPPKIPRLAQITWRLLQAREIQIHQVQVLDQGEEELLLSERLKEATRALMTITLMFEDKVEEDTFVIHVESGAKNHPC